MDMLRQASLFAKLTLLVDFVPLIMAVIYVVRPTERHLALMRPLSLAAIFAAIHGCALGVVNSFVYVANRPNVSFSTPAVLVGLAESFVTIVFDFGCLMLAWVCVAIGQWRRP